jgi:hypothetical protein
VADLHCEKRDTALERSGIREAHFVLQQLNDYLEEVNNAIRRRGTLSELRGICRGEQ